MNNLPKIIIPGFQKCATTALGDILDQHPRLRRADITLAKTGTDVAHGGLNEINYFSSEWHKKDISWYNTFFEFGPEEGKYSRATTMWYEKSPSYASCPEAAQRIYQTIPDVKLIFVVRDPEDRAFSAFNHYNQVMPSSTGWDGWNHELNYIENLQNNDAFYVDYASVLKRYSDYFDRKNILILVQEHLRQKPDETYSKIFKFLNINEHYKIENKLVHARRKTVPRDALVPEVEERFEGIRQDLYDWLGYEIEEWKR